ncbi:hypothetical protein Adt_26586 [Abeliophyllum distichum]|uniref:Uncharacterized protein n=1 Tax=Abeliophyllum distichum TaxID=126358 RepID=A0ABD1RT66_9LAMI
MVGFYFSKIHMFKIRGGKVVNEKETLPPRPPIPSTAPISASTVPLFMEVVGGVSSFLPTLSTVFVLTAIVMSTVEAVRCDSSSLFPETSINPLVDVQYQDKEKGLP